MGVLSQAALAGSSAPFADAANAMWGGTFLGLTWGKWISLVAIAATLGALNGWIMLSARVSLAAADDGLFPRPFSGGRRRSNARVRARYLLGARERARALQLERRLRRSLHRHRPARDVDDADRVEESAGVLRRTMDLPCNDVHIRVRGENTKQVSCNLSRSPEAGDYVEFMPLKNYLPVR